MSRCVAGQNAKIERYARASVEDGDDATISALGNGAQFEIMTLGWGVRRTTGSGWHARGVLCRRPKATCSRGRQGRHDQTSTGGAHPDAALEKMPFSTARPHGERWLASDRFTTGGKTRQMPGRHSQPRRCDYRNVCTLRLAAQRRRHPCAPPAPVSCRQLSCCPF
jgi:hypothetical protein